jgi:hypothetical protein
VRLLDETGRGTKLWKLLQEPFPSLGNLEDAEPFRDAARDRRRRFDELIDELDGAFAPRQWDMRLLPAPPSKPPLPGA